MADVARLNSEILIKKLLRLNYKINVLVCIGGNAALGEKYSIPEVGVIHELPLLLGLKYLYFRLS
jgi:hypothetical protein